MKKYLLFLLTFFIATLTFAYEAQIDGIYYGFDHENMTAMVTCYKRSSYNCIGYPQTEIIIPEKVTYNDAEYSVTSIGDYAFCYCSSLTSITIPNSVTSIGDYAFYNCTSLISITIPNSVTSIGSRVFGGCLSLIVIEVDKNNENYVSVGGVLYDKNITTLLYCPGGQSFVEIPNSVTSIGEAAFSGCSSLTSITIPNSVTLIGEWAFSGCSSLTSITIPNSVTSIGEAAFSDCSSLTTITIPNSVTLIGDFAFQSCSSLTTITIPNSVISIGGGAFNNCSSLTSLSIPNSVTSIESMAFQSCSSLTTITIPNSVTSIESSAFNCCSSLTSITIPNSVTSIGYSAFSGCSSLSTITIPNSITSIEDHAFYCCSSLTSITIPNSVTSIGDYTFYKCSSLASVTIPNSVTSIGKWAFHNTPLVTVIIPNSVTSIGDHAFYYCSSLTSITIPNSVTSIGNNVFNGCNALVSLICEFSNSVDCQDNILNGKTNLCYFKGPAKLMNIFTEASQTKYSNKLTEIHINDGELDENGFNYINRSKNSLHTIDLAGATNITINDLAFYKYYKLENFIFSENIETIGYKAFAECINLKSIKLPYTTKTIQDLAFANCIKVDTIQVDALIPPTITSTSFDKVSRDIEFIVPVEARDAYESDEYWRVFMPTTDVENLIENIEIYATNGTFQIEGLEIDYQIHSTIGKLIYSGHDTSLSLPRGIYLVTINGKTQKVAL